MNDPVRVRESRTGTRRNRTAVLKSGDQTAVPLKREEILEEAARLFRELGYDRTRMQDIASAFGVTHAALYYYFPRKNHILAELNLSALDTLLAGANAIQESSISPAERFQSQFDAHVRFVIGNLPLAACFFHYDEAMEPKALKKIHSRRRQYTEILTISFSEAQAVGDFASDLDPKTAVNTLLGAANWMYRWLNVESESDPDRLASQVGGLLAKGFRRT
jgi:TetR/AcrR family transcriptional regulator, cholesterol catabolism regulator